VDNEPVPSTGTRRDWKALATKARRSSPRFVKIIDQGPRSTISAYKAGRIRALQSDVWRYEFQCRNSQGSRADIFMRALRREDDDAP